MLNMKRREFITLLRRWFSQFAATIRDETLSMA